MYLLLTALIVLGFLSYLAVTYFFKKQPDERSQEIIHSATQRADQILAQAEAEGIKIATESKLGANLFQETYEQKFQKALEDSQKEFSLELTKLREGYSALISSLQDQSTQEQQQLQEMMKSRINDTLLKFEQNLSNYLTSAEQKSFEAINLELKSARQLIDTYKSQQLALVDENIVAVLERTLSLVTKEKLSLKEQLDLVYEALEKAKVEKFFA